MNIPVQLTFIQARLREHASVPGTDSEVSTRIIFTETISALIMNILDYESSIDDESYCCHNSQEIAIGECQRSNRGIDSLNLIAGLWSDHPGYKEFF